MFATQLFFVNNVYSLQVDPAKTLVTRQWLFDNGFKINNYKTRNGVTTFTLRSWTNPGLAKLTAKYPANGVTVSTPAPVTKTVTQAAPAPTPVIEESDYSIFDEDNKIEDMMKLRRKSSSAYRGAETPAQVMATRQQLLARHPGDNDAEFVITEEAACRLATIGFWLLEDDITIVTLAEAEELELA